MKALETEADVFFCIYNKKVPILIQIERRIQFRQKKDEKIIFRFKLHKSFDEVDLDINLHHGSIEVSISDTQEFKNPTKFEIPS